MAEAWKTTPIPTGDRGEAPAGAGRPAVPGLPADWTRLRRQWGLIALVAVLSVGLDAAIVVKLRGRIAGRTAPGPGSHPRQEPVRGGAKPGEHAARGNADEARGARPADGGAGPQAARPVGPPRPAEAVAAAPAPAPARAPAAPQPPADPVSLGRELFARTWLPNDPRCHGGDGLGPVYNAASCVECHRLGAPGGAGPGGLNVFLMTGVGYIVHPDRPRADIPFGNSVGGGPGGALEIVMAPRKSDLVKAHPGFRESRSAVVHRYGVNPDYDRWLRTAVRNVESDRHTVNVLGDSGVMIAVSERNATPLFGAGMIDALSDLDLERAVGQEPHAVRGRVRRLKDGRIGRFGWKAQMASLEDFVLTACANELGLEVPGHHQAPSPLAPDATASRPDLTQKECDALVAYVRSLPQPVVLDEGGPGESTGVAKGRELFRTIGCAECHLPDLGPIQGIYSDLALHEMGSDLSDPGDYYDDEAPRVPGAVGRGEWRTPPLWGFRDSAPYLHDGRARNLAGAVAQHQGQARFSRIAFQLMSADGRAEIEAFLNSLAAPGVSRPARHRAPRPDGHGHAGADADAGADPAPHPDPGRRVAGHGSVLGGG